MSWLSKFSTWWRGPRKWGGSYFYPLASRAFQAIGHLDAFLSIPELNAVLSLRARAFSNAVLKIVDSRGREMVNHRYNPLLRNFNWFQPQKEFMRQTKLFADIFGNEYLYMLRPVGLDNVKALFSLPPNLVECRYTAPSPFFTFDKEPKIEYSIQANGRKIPLDAASIIHMNSDRVNISSVKDENLLQGESKLTSLEPVLSNLKAVYESRGVILRNRGAMGILTNDNKDALGSSLGLDPDERKDLQEAYSRYGSLSHQSQIVITNLPLRWQPMEVSPNRLGIWEETREGFNKILDTFGVPGDLFVRDKGATYENQNQARKVLYENAVIPEANEWTGALNDSFMQGDPGKIIATYDHLPCFQEDKKKTADANSVTVNYLSRLLADQVISVNEYREELAKRTGIGSKSLNSRL